jgi:hypothetical protein
MELIVDLPAMEAIEGMSRASVEVSRLGAWGQGRKLMSDIRDVLPWTSRQIQAIYGIGRWSSIRGVFVPLEDRAEGCSCKASVSDLQESACLTLNLSAPRTNVDAIQGIRSFAYSADAETTGMAARGRIPLRKGPVALARTKNSTTAVPRF